MALTHSLVCNSNWTEWGTIQRVIERVMSKCVVPENIHTPTMEGIGHSGGVGGQRPRKFRRGGGLSVKLRFQMVKFDAVTTQLKIASYQLWRHLA